MGLDIVIGLVVVLFVGGVARRSVTRRRADASVEGYEHAMEVLADLPGRQGRSKRSPKVRLEVEEEVNGPELRPAVPSLEPKPSFRVTREAKQGWPFPRPLRGPERPSRSLSAVPDSSEDLADGTSEDEGAGREEAAGEARQPAVLAFFDDTGTGRDEPARQAGVFDLDEEADAAEVDATKADQGPGTYEEPEIYREAGEDQEAEPHEEPEIYQEPEVYQELLETQAIPRVAAISDLEDAEPQAAESGEDPQSWRPRSGSSSRGPRPPRGRTAVLAGAGATVAAVAAVTVVVVALMPGGHAKSPSGSNVTSPTAPSSTTTTAPPTLIPTSRSATLSNYVVASSNFTVSLQASGPCWIEARSSSTGTISWQGTLQGGQSKSFVGQGSLWLRLGDAKNASLTVNGEPVSFQSPGAVPYDLSFTSSAA